MTLWVYSKVSEARFIKPCNDFIPEVLTLYSNLTVILSNYLSQVFKILYIIQELRVTSLSHIHH